MCVARVRLALACSWLLARCMRVIELRELEIVVIIAVAVVRRRRCRRRCRIASGRSTGGRCASLRSGCHTQAHTYTRAHTTSLSASFLPARSRPLSIAVVVVVVAGWIDKSRLLEPGWLRATRERAIERQPTQANTLRQRLSHRARWPACNELAGRKRWRHNHKVSQRLALLLSGSGGGG